MPDSNADPPEVAHFRARLDRAAEHYHAFGATWAAYLDRRPHRLALEVNDNGAGVVRLIEHEPMPVDLPLLLGEFLYQLRAALDNCLYAVAVIESGQRPPPNADRLEWPICLTTERWQRNFHRLSALSDSVREALERIQPYRAEAPDWNCLRILHDLARVDRHRALHLVTVYGTPANARVELSRVADLDIRVGVIPEDGVVATFRWRGSAAVNPDDFDLDLTFEPEMAGVVESAHPVHGTPSRPWGALDARLKALLRAVHEYTEGLVMLARGDATLTEQVPTR